MEEACVEKTFTCGSGTVVVVACRPPVDPLRHPRSRPRVFRWVQPGSLSVEYSDDWSKGYFAYIVPGGGGFYMEADLDALDDPRCGDEVVPWILGFLGEFTEPRLMDMLRVILPGKVFRSGGAAPLL